jgi:hypothetical protein
MTELPAEADALRAEAVDPCREAVVIFDSPETSRKIMAEMVKRLDSPGSAVESVRYRDDGAVIVCYKPGYCLIGCEKHSRQGGDDGEAR